MNSLTQRHSFPAVLLIAALIGAGCTNGCGNIGAVSEDLDPLFEALAKDPLVLDPVVATSVGYHSHTQKGPEGEAGATIDLDTKIGDFSSAGIAARVSFYSDLDARLRADGKAGDYPAMPTRDTTKGDRWVNFAVMENRIGRAKFDLEKEKDFTTNPGFYVRVLGNALFTPTVLEYAPENDRYADIIARLGEVPTVLQQAQSTLTKSSELHISSARSGIAGLIELIQNGIPENLPSGLQGQYDGAAGPAVEALKAYDAFVAGMDSSGEWRMGSSLYAERIKLYTGGYDQSLDAILTSLQTEFDDTYKQLIDTAKPIHRGIYGSGGAPNDFLLMRDILDVVSDENRLRDGGGLVDRIKENVDEVKQFMQSEELVALPNIGLTIADTPDFLRRTNPVDAFQAPPLLNPEEGAQYWVTPIPANWSRAETLAKLREYNNFKLKIVAIDGYARYAQAVLSAQVEGENNRLIRNVDPNLGFTRGWVWYLVESTIDLGYQSGNAQFKLNWFKYKLEFLASCILDIKLHAQDMPLDEARELLRRKVFMEDGAIESAVQRIQMTPTNAVLAYVGSKQWLEVKDAYQDETTDFSLQSFHTKALTSGPMPPAELIYSAVGKQKQ